MTKPKYTGSRDPRFVTIRRGGTLSDENHHQIALWAAKCAEHVLPLFNDRFPDDKRPQMAIESTRAWAWGSITMTQAREASFASHAAAKETDGAASLVARAAAHAVATAHMADHELGAAAYAIKARITQNNNNHDAGFKEREWQRSILPDCIKELILSDQKNRNRKFWSLFFNE